MTEQDRINFDIIDDIVTRVWGFDDDSLAYFRREIRNPTLDPAYQIVGPDLRIRWPIKCDDPQLQEIQAEGDTGWVYFKQAFRGPVALAGISYNNYVSNKKMVGKNEIKLKKVLMDFYEANPNYFLEYFVADYVNESKRNLSIMADANRKAFMENVEKYIIKAFEVIGKYKAPKKDFELVLSMNFADWFLCSTKQSWSSCLNLDGGGYWRGIASLIGDKNRGFLYVANGKKKNFKGIIVDEVVSRTWVLLDEKDKKNLVRFYPNDFLSIDTIRKVSGDNSYRMIDGSFNVAGKREVEPVLFKKGKSFMTIFNDACAIDSDKLAKTRKLFTIIGKKGCFQYLPYGSDRVGGIDPGDMLSRVDRYLEGKKTINDYITAFICNECGVTINREYARKDRAGNYYCEKCSSKVIKQCPNCGNYDHIGQMKEFTKADGTKISVCSRCAGEVLRCDCCGDITFRSNSIVVRKKDENGKKTSVFICRTCQPHVAACKYCGDVHYKKELLTFKDKDTSKQVCSFCFANREENVEFIGYDACGDCRNIFKIEELIFDHRANGFCTPCVKKAIDKKQLKFSFIK